jgi:hypothetical protein
LLQEVFCSSTTFGRTHLPRTFALTFLTLSNYI